MKTTHKNLILLLSLATLLNACETKQNLDEMHDATIEMNRTTQDMSKRTSDLENATGELYDALRQGDSLAARRSALDNLVKATEPARKLSEAAKYFMSFEYQLWMNENHDKGEERRLELATLAAREFFKDVYQFIPNGNMTPDPFSGQVVATETSNLVNSLNALAVTTHFLNPKQEKHLKDRKDMKPLSMNMMIEESLLAKNSIESGAKRISDYPGYVFEVLSNEPAAVYLLEARYNYLATLFLGRATNVAHSKVQAVKYIAKKWTLDLSKFNAAQIEELNMFLKGALETKKTLQQIGVKPRTAALLARMLNNMTLVDLSTSGQLSTAKATTFQEINTHIAELKKF